MNLWSVTIRRDCTREGKPPIIFTDHEVIVDANTPSEAQSTAKDWLQQNHPCTESMQQSEMRIIEVEEIQHIRIYNDDRISAKVHYEKKSRIGRI